MIEVTSVTKTVTTGLEIKISGDDLVHLKFALNKAREQYTGLNRWPWLEKFYADIKKAGNDEGTL